MTLRFAAVGIDHFHIFDHIEGLLDAGAEFAGHVSDGASPRIVEGIARTWPDVPVLTGEEVFADETIAVVCNAAVNVDRADMTIEAMRHGKDVMIDKPGATTLDQVARLRAAVAETGRIFSICFSERVTVRAAEKAGKLVQDTAALSVWLANGSRAGPSMTLGSRREISRLRFGLRNLVAEGQTEPYTMYRDSWTFTAGNEAQQAKIDAALAADPHHEDSYTRQFELFHQALETGGELPVTLDDARTSLE